MLDDVLAGLDPGHLRPATPPVTLQRCRLLAEGL
jgi:hypothetical protein